MTSSILRSLWIMDLPDNEKSFRVAKYDVYTIEIPLAWLIIYNVSYYTQAYVSLYNYTNMLIGVGKCVRYIHMLLGYVAPMTLSLNIIVFSSCITCRHTPNTGRIQCTPSTRRPQHVEGLAESPYYVTQETCPR